MFIFSDTHYLYYEKDKLIDLFQEESISKDEILRRSNLMYDRIRKNKDLITKLENEIESYKSEQKKLTKEQKQSLEKSDKELQKTKDLAWSTSELFLPPLLLNEKGEIKKREYIEKYVKQVKVWKVDKLEFKFEELPVNIYGLGFPLFENKPLFKVNDSVVYAEMIAFDERITLKAVMSTYSKNLYAGDDLEFNKETFTLKRIT